MSDKSKRDYSGRIVDEDACGATHVLLHAVASPRAFAGETPFVNPSNGKTMEPYMPSFLYGDIAKAHADLGELLTRVPNPEEG